MSFVKRKYHAPGTAPGTYDTIATRERAEPPVTVIDISAEQLRRHNDLSAVATSIQGTTRWIRVSGHPSLQTLDTLREALALDPLILEDVANVGQRPKFTDLESHQFAVLNLPDEQNLAVFHQLSICLVGQTVVSFDDGEKDWLEPIARRMEKSQRLRQGGAGFLFYAMIDLAVDLLFPWLQRAGDELDRLEEALLEVPTAELLAQVHDFRRNLLVLRRIAWATRDLVSDVTEQMAHREEDRLQVYLGDAKDHIFTIIDMIEIHRDVAATLVEMHMSMLSNRMNDVMKVLTVIATLFIPPTFIVGVYGMNFDRRAGPWSMPELGWPLGYVWVMLTIGVLMVGMVWYFKRKGWL